MNHNNHSWTSNIIELQEYQKGYKQIRNSEIHTILKRNRNSKMSQVKTRLKLTLDFLNDVKVAYDGKNNYEIEKIEKAISEIKDFLLIHELNFEN